MYLDARMVDFCHKLERRCLERVLRREFDP